MLQRNNLLVKLPKKQSPEVIETIELSSGESDDEEQNDKSDKLVIIGQKSLDYKKTFNEWLQFQPTQNVVPPQCNLERFNDRIDLNIGEFITIADVKPEKITVSPNFVLGFD